jgi:hypothetical protein
MLFVMILLWAKRKKEFGRRKNKESFSGENPLVKSQSTQH